MSSALSPHSPEDSLGVFDSGLGGLTVVKALRAALPQEHIVYLGDTARVPYGAKGPATIFKYALRCAQALAERRIKLLVIACNTASSVRPELAILQELGLTALGVIDPCARAAVAATRTGRIGVLGTVATIASGAHARAVEALSPPARVVGQAAPLLVPLVEEGWVEGEIPERIVQVYLQPLAAAHIDTLVLGCTHYPLLRHCLLRGVREQIGPQVVLVDAAEATAKEVQHYLMQHGLLRRQSPPPMTLCATDIPASFAALASRFLGEKVLPEVELIDL